MKIGFCGSMSTGKTTLVNALREHSFFKDTHYRFFTERSKELMAMGVPLNDKSNYKGQLMFFAERATELTYPFMVTDRTAIDVYAFSMTSDISIPHKYILGTIKDSLINDYDIIFYVPIIDEIPMVDNGVREVSESYRRKIDVAIREGFEKHSGKKYMLTRNNIDDRIREIYVVLKELEKEK